MGSGRRGPARTAAGEPHGGVRIPEPMSAQSDSDLLSLPVEAAVRVLALTHLEAAALARSRLEHDDEEALHDFRVALRRLRSCLRAYRPLLQSSLSGKLVKALRRLARRTGTGRDAEVQLEWLQKARTRLRGRQRVGHEWMRRRIEAQRERAYDKIRNRVAGDFDALAPRLREQLTVYQVQYRLDRAHTAGSFAEETAARVLALEDALRRDLERIHAVTDLRQAHQARITAKRLRYLLEPLSGSVPEAAGAVKCIKSLQDLLGALNDARVLFTEVRTAVAAAAGEQATCLFDLKLSQPADAQALREQRARDSGAGLLAIGRLLRERIEALYAELERDWLAGALGQQLEDVLVVARALEAMGEAPAGLPEHSGLE